VLAICTLAISIKSYLLSEPSLRNWALYEFRLNDCEIMIMLKHNQHHQITLSISSSVCYNSRTAAKQHLKLMI